MNEKKSFAWRIIAGIVGTAALLVGTWFALQKWQPALVHKTVVFVTSMTFQWWLLVAQLLFLSGLGWYMTKIVYFKNVFTGLVGTTILCVASWLALQKWQPALVHTIIGSPGFMVIWKSFKTNVDLAGANKDMALLNLAAAGLSVLWIYAYRIIYPWLQKKVFAYRKRLSDQEDATALPQVADLAEWVTPGKFFFGVSSEGPQYLQPGQLTHHVQVVGPSGTGKTKSVLFPLAMQAIDASIPVIFVDGKGDSGLIKDFLAADPDMLVFNPMRPQESHSYNPLVSSKDPVELMNMIASGMNLDAPGEAKVYTDMQKKYLLSLLGLFVSTEKAFNFVDIGEFTTYQESRSKVMDLSKSDLFKEDMRAFMGRLKKSEKELVGLSTQIDQLFTYDPGITSVLNVYDPDIRIKDVMSSNKRVIFSFSTGMKAQTNEAIAKMLLADIANAVGERHARGSNNDFILLILDEFGQYVNESFDKFISTCRSANVGVVLSHQTNAQLKTKDGSDRLSQIVRENTATKVILRQSEEASFWAECFGTQRTYKQTDQTVGGDFGTEKVSGTGSLREVDEFVVHPNEFRQLPVGRAVFKTGHELPAVINCGMWNVKGSARTASIKKTVRDAVAGLNLRAERLSRV